MFSVHFLMKTPTFSTFCSRVSPLSRLARSTLSLIPLLGIQYLATGFIDYLDAENTAVKAVRYFENIFVSIQVCVVG